MNSAQPRVMCARCQAIFPEPANHEGSDHEDTVTCPECNHQGKPGGVMQAATFPSVAAFRRNWQASQQVAQPKTHDN